MKTASRETLMIVEEITDGPILSLSHLSASFTSGDALQDNPDMGYGFPASREESLYETGFLVKIFLRC